MIPGADISPLLRRYGSSAPARTFVIAPCAGGSASLCVEWMPYLLGDNDAAMAVQYPNRSFGRKGPAPHSLVALAEQVARELMQHADGPLIMIGHSMGGVVAYEMTRRLEAEGCYVQLLTVSSVRAPDEIGIDPEAIRLMTRDDWRAELLKQELLDEEGLALPDLIDQIVPTLRSDYLLLAGHTDSGGAVSCPVYLMCGSEDHWVTPDQMASWGKRTTGSFRQTVFPGRHFFYRDQLQRVCQSILSLLDKGASEPYT
jgi:medium-chain acyl-[acyl-carrier-protein] hydrolase